MLRATPLDLAQASGARVSILDLQERRDLMRSWRETFARSVKSQTGKWVHLGFEWHAFSYEFAQCKRGHRALALYLAETAPEAYVVPENERNHAFRCRASTLLDFSTCQVDLLVFPSDLKWTVAFTHEPDFGPYFSRAEWCSLHSDLSD
jgi:hypothetical protein